MRQPVTTRSLWILTVALLLGAGTVAQAAPVQWSGNGHWYEKVPADVTWDQARAAAESATFATGGTTLRGHLATLTEQGEWDFVKTNLTAKAWLGGYQDTAAADYVEPAGGWRWITGETWAYTSWTPAGPGYPAEPNDTPHPENYLMSWDTLGWNDAAPDHRGEGLITAYLVEYEVDSDTRYSVSGQAADNSSNGLAGVQITAGLYTATTDANGNYALTGLPAGSYTVTPARSGYTFTPASTPVTVGPSRTGVNFTGAVAPSGPTVIANSPTGTAVNAELPVITVAFSTAMDKESAQEALSIAPARPGAPAQGWPGSFAWAANQMQYRLATSLAPGVVYTVTIGTGARSSGGTPMAAPKVWSFTTSAAPAVVAYSPTGLSVPPRAGCVISITFNQPMIRSSANQALWVYKTGTATPPSPLRPAGAFSWSGNVMSYTLRDALAPATRYTVRLVKTATSAAGTPRATDFSWAFTTVGAPVVTAHGPQGLAVSPSAAGRAITIAFDQPMVRSSVNNALWIYKTGAATPPTPLRPLGAFSWSGNVMTYTLKANLAPLTRYTVRLGKTATSAAGVPLAANFSWVFKTAAAAAPATVAVTAAPTPAGAQITLRLASAAQVSVHIRNLAGREVAVLQPGELAPGTHSLLWNGRSARGTQVPPGPYLLQVNARAADGSSTSAVVSLRR